MDLMEKIGYLKGLLEGLDILESKEAKVFNAITDILDEMADSIALLDDSVCELEVLADTLDEDFGSLEEDFYSDDCDCDDCDCDCDDCDCDCDEECDCEEYYEVVCPTCGDTVCLIEEMLLEGGIDCPNCGEHLEFDLDDEEATEKSE